MGKWLANAVGMADPDGRRYDTYIGSRADPLFYFGQGLSYTTFAYDDLSVAAIASGAGAADDGAVATVAVTVANTGDARAGVEVVQVRERRLVVVRRTVLLLLMMARSPSRAA